MLAFDHPLVMPEPNSGCFLWMGSLAKKGYGRRVAGHTDWRPAHRVFYEAERGVIPAGMILRHRCDNPRCVNPDHMLPGTYADNSQDMVSKGRQSRGRVHSEKTRAGIPLGHKKRFLSHAEAAEIIRLKGTLTQEELAWGFDCSLRTIIKIHQGKWRPRRGSNRG